MSQDGGAKEEQGQHDGEGWRHDLRGQKAQAGPADDVESDLDVEALDRPTQEGAAFQGVHGLLW